MTARIRIDATEIRKIARLAQLGLSADDLRTLPAQLATILDHVAELDGLELGGHSSVDAARAGAAASAAMRQDRPLASLEPETAVASAPDTAAGFFRVPRVIRSAD